MVFDPFAQGLATEEKPATNAGFDPFASGDAVPDPAPAATDGSAPSVYTWDNFKRGIKTLFEDPRGVRSLPARLDKSIQASFDDGGRAPIPKIPMLEQKGGTAEQIARGAANTVSGAVNALPTAGTMASLNPVGAPIVAADMLYHAFKGAPDAGRAIVDPNVSAQQATEKVAGTVLSALPVLGLKVLDKMGGKAAAAGDVKSETPVAPEDAAKIEEQRAFDPFASGEATPDAAPPAAAAADSAASDTGPANPTPAEAAVAATDAPAAFDPFKDGTAEPVAPAAQDVAAPVDQSAAADATQAPAPEEPVQVSDNFGASPDGTPPAQDFAIPPVPDITTPAASAEEPPASAPEGASGSASVDGGQAPDTVAAPRQGATLDVPRMPDLARASGEEIDAWREASREFDRNIDVAVFGEERAKEYRRAQRMANSTMDPARADEGSRRVAAMEATLTPQQERILYGQDLPEGYVDPETAGRLAASAIDIDAAENVGDLARASSRIVQEGLRAQSDEKPLDPVTSQLFMRTMRRARELGVSPKQLVAATFAYRSKFEGDDVFELAGTTPEQFLEFVRNNADPSAFRIEGRKATDAAMIQSSAEVPVQAREAADGAQFVRRTPIQAAADRAQLEQLQEQWKANAQQVAPGLMERFKLQFGDPQQLVRMGRADARNLTGFEEAAYLAHEKMLFLFDRALQMRSDIGTTINMVHEMGHAFWDTLSRDRQDELVGQWQKEMQDRTGPLFTKDGALKRGVARGIETSVKEWFAERIAWANHQWARRRIELGAKPVSDGLVGRIAQQFRQTLLKLREYVEKLRGNKLDTEFRSFLDQGERFADVPAQAELPMAAAARELGLKAEFSIRDAKDWMRRNFTSAAGLPKEAFERKLTKDARFAAVLKQSEFALRDFDRAVKSVYGGYRAMTPADLAQINDVLGGKAPVASLDPRIQAAVGTMRNHVDTLSRRLVHEGAISGELAAKVSGNVGFYLNRSYRKFDDPKWAKRVPEVIRNRAESFITAELTKKNKGVPPRPEEVKGYLDYLLSKHVDGAQAFYQPSRTGAKDLSIFVKRQEIPREIRDFMGEYADPRVNYLRSVAKTAQVLESHAFLVDVRQAGIRDGWLHDRPITNARAAFVVPIASIGSDALAPLNGLYTSKDIAQAFAGMPKPGDTAWRWWLRANGWAKVAKTAFSPMTQTRNFAGNLGFLIANGHWRANAGAEVWRALKADFGYKDTPATRAYVSRLTRLGIVGESVNAGELREALSDSGAKMTGIEDFTDKRLVRAAKAPFKAALRVYRTNDDIFKIYAFENERRAWAAADPTLTAEQLDAIAAERVRNTFPTYALIPRAAQWVRRVGITGSFLSWPAEIIRTGYHTIGYALRDLSSSNPRVKAIGAKRLGGIIAMATTPYAASKISQWLANVDAKDDDQLRRFLPDWNQNADLYYQANDGRGRFRMIDVSYLDPYSYLKKPVRAALRGENWMDALQGAALEAMSPFGGEGLLTKGILDLARNRDDRGVPVYNPQAPFLDQSMQKIGHIWDIFEPGFVTQARRIVRGANGYVSPTGRMYNVSDEAQAILTGARSQSIDVVQALMFHAKRFAAERAAADQIYTQARDSRGTVAPGELEQARAKMEQSRKALQNQINEDAHAALMLGATQGEVVEAMLGAGLSRTDAALALSGRYLPYLDKGPNRDKALQTVLLRR